MPRLIPPASLFFYGHYLRASGGLDSERGGEIATTALIHTVHADMSTPGRNVTDRLYPAYYRRGLVQRPKITKKRDMVRFPFPRTQKKTQCKHIFRRLGEWMDNRRCTCIACRWKGGSIIKRKRRRKKHSETDAFGLHRRITTTTITTSISTIYCILLLRYLFKYAT